MSEKIIKRLAHKVYQIPNIALEELIVRMPDLLSIDKDELNLYYQAAIILAKYRK